MKDDKAHSYRPSDNNFFYFVSKGKFSICDLDFCDKSERAFDMRFFDLANNADLLSKLGLYYIHGNFGMKYTHDARARWFCGYLAAFCPNDNGQYEKSLTNPMIRLLVEDETLFSEVKKSFAKVKKV